MHFDIQILDLNSVTNFFNLSFRSSNFQQIFVDNVCVIDVFKIHSHRYDIKCFFYLTRHIYYRECIGTKKELLSVIQNLLQKNLYDVLQFASG